VFAAGAGHAPPGCPMPVYIGKVGNVADGAVVPEVFCSKLTLVPLPDVAPLLVAGTPVMTA